MLPPNRLEIVRDAYKDARRKGLSPAEAWKAASAEYEGLKAEYQAQGKQEPERPTPAPDDEQLTELIDPRRRAALFARRPELAHRLSEQVGWPKVRRHDGAGWDQTVLNEWLLSERLDAVDPREELRAKAQKLAEETKVDFMAALETAKAQHPELVEKIATYNTMMS
jgi:hypothetical protein